MLVDQISIPLLDPQALSLMNLISSKKHQHGSLIFVSKLNFTSIPSLMNLIKPTIPTHCKLYPLPQVNHTQLNYHGNLPRKEIIPILNSLQQTSPNQTFFTTMPSIQKYSDPSNYKSYSYITWSWIFTLSKLDSINEDM